MDFYDIVSLIVFLKKQSKQNFEGILELLEIVDSKDIPETEKGELFITTLRKYGLHEVEVERAPEEESDDIPKNVPDEIIWKRYRKGLIQVDLYECKLINGKVNFIQIQN